MRDSREIPVLNDAGGRNRLADIVEAAPNFVATARADGHLEYMNPAGRRLLGISPDEEVTGTVIREYHPEWAFTKLTDVGIPAAIRDGLWTGETALMSRSGQEIPVSQTVISHRGADGRLEFLSTICRDLRPQMEARQREERIRTRLLEESEAHRRSEELIVRQAREILDISIPAVQVWEGILVVPLIGILDTTRARRFMDTLLNRIAETGSRVVIVDITGVPAIDSQTAQHLIETFAAIKLLGAMVVLTGVSASIAQTVVRLGIGLAGVVTRASLAAGLDLALAHCGLRIANTGPVT